MATTAPTSASTVVGYFSTPEKAHTAFHALTDAGFSPENIGIAARDNSTSGASTGKTDEPGVWDKVKTFFGAGNEAEPYAGESTGNPLDSREVTYSDYSSEDVHGTLGRLNVPEEHSRYFGHRFGNDQGATVITVTAPGRVEEARTILEESGADLGDEAEDYEYTDTPEANVTGDQNIRLYGEVLRVHKDRVSAGEVRLRKEVFTEVQTVEVPVTREELVIERVAASGEQPATGASFKGEEIRIPLSQEVASIDKHAVLREEVRVGKREVTDIEALDEEVRREELRVEDSTVKSTEFGKR